MKKCSICGKVIANYGNNPYPIRSSENARCCDDCNTLFVVPARLVEAYDKANALPASKFSKMDYTDLLIFFKVAID